jgi:hypothetical protein
VGSARQTQLRATDTGLFPVFSLSILLHPTLTKTSHALCLLLDAVQGRTRMSNSNVDTHRCFSMNVATRERV